MFRITTLKKVKIIFLIYHGIIYSMELFSSGRPCVSVECSRREHLILILDLENLGVQQIEISDPITTEVKAGADTDLHLREPLIDEG